MVRRPAEGPLQPPMPIVAVQRPIQHHQPAGQAPIGERALQPEGLTGLLERLRQSWLAGRIDAFRGVGREPIALQLTHHHPGG